MQKKTQSSSMTEENDWLTIDRRGGRAGAILGAGSSRQCPG